PAAFGRDPGDDLVWVGNVAGFAMNAVRWIQADALAAGLWGVLDHLIDASRTKILARVAEFFHAAAIADVGVVNHKMRRLVFFMFRARVVEVGELVESDLAVASSGAEEVCFVAAIRWQFGELPHMLIARS